MRTTISSAQNDKIKRIRRLQQKKHRQAEALYFVEGIRAVLTAIERRAEIVELLLSPALLTSEKAIQTVAAVESDVPVFEVEERLFASISSRQHPTGLGAVIRFDGLSMGDLTVGQTSLFVGLVDVGDPGNLGTILRTADAAGASAVVTVGAGVDKYHPAAVRASMGAIFAVPCPRLPDVGALFAWAAANGIRTVATSARSKVDFRQITYERPLLLIMGSEAEGLDEAVIERADYSVGIPMAGSSSSLNLAVATGLMLFQANSS